MEEAAAPAGAAAASAGLAFKSCAASVGTELMPLQTSSLLMSLMSVVLLLALALLIAILAALLAIVVGFLVLLVLNWQQISRYVQITDDKRADRALDVNGTLSHVGGFVKRPPTNRISFKSEILNPVASIEKQNFGQLPNGQMPKDKYGLTVADISASSSAAVFHRKGFYFTTERNLDSDLKLYNSQGPDDISKDANLIQQQKNLISSKDSTLQDSPLQPALHRRRSSNKASGSIDPDPTCQGWPPNDASKPLMCTTIPPAQRHQPEPPKKEEPDRPSMWDVPKEMLKGLRGTKRWDARVDISHSDGFVESLNMTTKLGSGAFGQVYLCNWEGAKAAVKLIELQGKKEAGKQSSVDMFLQEAEVAAILRHPNIVQVFKVNLEHVPGSDTYQGAIVMEYCEMGSLADAIKKNMFTFEHSNSPLMDLQLMLKVAEDVARGVLFLHNQGILHGDLKPNNILLKKTADGTGAKLTDFGLSVKMSCSQTHVSQHQTGTLDHMAPEVMMEGRSSKRSDVYAFGIVLWEIFCCSRPYVGMRDVAIVHKVVEEDLRPVFPRDAPREYVELASACWEKDPAKRPDFSEVVAKVEQMNMILMRLLNSQGAGHEPEDTISESIRDADDVFAQEMDGDISI